VQQKKRKEVHIPKRVLLCTRLHSDPVHRLRWRTNRLHRFFEVRQHLRLVVSKNRNDFVQQISALECVPIFVIAPLSRLRVPEIDHVCHDRDVIPAPENASDFLIGVGSLGFALLAGIQLWIGCLSYPTPI